MSKRRIFDIDFPTEETPRAPADAQEVASRRGPMAAAVEENIEALNARQKAEAAIRDENDKLAHEMVRLRAEGLIVDRIDLDKIQCSKLIRDRSPRLDPELGELIESIKSVGLSNPIQVEQTENDCFELVQGFRRLCAFRQLFKETGDVRYSKIPAGLAPKGEAIGDLYRKMVDENLVRKDISFAEMAQLAVSYADDPKTDCRDVRDAVAELYASAGRQKRSYIAHFSTLMRLIGSELQFSEAIPRSVGLRLVKAFQEGKLDSKQVQMSLLGIEFYTPEEEVLFLRRLLDRPAKATPKTPKGSAAKTSFRMTVPAGTVQCQARNGRVEMQMDRDFSDLGKPTLERAVAAFLKALDEGKE